MGNLWTCSPSGLTTTSPSLKVHSRYCISETIWRTSSDDHKRQYVYRYDNLNRLLDAAYIKNYNPDKGTFSVINAYNENLKYDKNGNILSLSRTGEQDLSSNTVDIGIIKQILTC